MLSNLNSNLKRSEVIKQFLDERAQPDMALMYRAGMEVQVNVARAGGERITIEKGDRTFEVWANEDQTEEWYKYRMPKNADTEPIDNDHPVTFDHFKYVEAIGLTGWNYIEKASYFVGFDIDHTVNHQRGLTDAQVQETKEAACSIPWISVRRSTSGTGLHIYVEFDQPIKTENHVEHAALARSIMDKMSAKTGFNFNPKVDVCGHIMWFWHTKMIGTNGLTLIKQGEKFNSKLIYANWKDHIDVISGKSQRVAPKTRNGQGLADLIKQKATIGLDAQHIAAINALEKEGSSSYFNSENNLVVTHTFLLKQLKEAAQLRGYFDTISTGKDCPHDTNCFCFPMANGAWAVYRFGQGTKEHCSWCQDGRGWTFTYFNRNPDLMTMARAYGAIETEKGWFLFREAMQAKLALAHLGVEYELKENMVRRPTRVREGKDGRVIVKIDSSTDDIQADMVEWESDLKAKTYTRLFMAPNKAADEQSYGTFDDDIRHIVSLKGDDMGWVIKDANARWNTESLTNVKMLMGAKNVKPIEMNHALGWAVDNPWRIVSRPFEQEYPGNRDWNRNAPQYAFHLLPPGTDLQFPTWNKILNHLGKDLTFGVLEDDWCKINQITTGAQYLKLWIASMLQSPMQPTPYLFFYGQQNTGKSIFHEALSLLMTSGYVRADQAMQNGGGFNGELMSAVLCVVEETDLKKDKRAFAHLKDWVTAIYLSIHIKGETPFLTENTTHWAQFSNHRDACPTFTGDTRTTYIYVESFGEEIPKRVMLNKLREEAAAFLTEMVMRTEIPESNGRLAIPPIQSADMEDVQRANESSLEKFLRDKINPVSGHQILASEFYEEFTAYLRDFDPHESVLWSSRKRIVSELPMAYNNVFGKRFVRGRSTIDSNSAYGNMSFDMEAKNNGEYVADGQMLRKVKGN